MAWLWSPSRQLSARRRYFYISLPQPFTAFALSAIAITYWYGGTLPGVFAALLSLIVRGSLLEP
jgi:hypothetical protein